MDALHFHLLPVTLGSSIVQSSNPVTGVSVRPSRMLKGPFAKSI